MNKKIAALLLSCLCMNASMFPMIQDEEAPLLPEREEDVSLSCRQKKAMILFGSIGGLVGGCAALLVDLIAKEPNSAIDMVTAASTGFAVCQTVGSCCFYLKFRAWNHESATYRANLRQQATVQAVRAAEREETIRYHRENPHVRIGENIEGLQRDLSEKKTLELEEVGEFQKRWRSIQENFSACEARYNDNEMRDDHERQLAEIDDAIKEKVGMGLQTYVKSAANEG